MKRFVGPTILAACAAVAACGEVGQVNSMAPSTVSVPDGGSSGARMSERMVLDVNQPSCPTGGPSGLHVSTHGHGVDVLWDVVANATDYVVDIRKNNGAGVFDLPVSGFPLMEDTTTRSFVLEAGSYEARVRPRSCGDYFGHWTIERFSIGDPWRPPVETPIIEFNPDAPGDPGSGDSNGGSSQGGSGSSESGSSDSSGGSGGHDGCTNGASGDHNDDGRVDCGLGKH